jgi:hypothetical protein
LIVEPSPAATLLERIREVGGRIRHPLLRLLEELGGAPPRPARLIRATGLDKSLASRLVRAVRSESENEFLHLVPSPTGLRIFAGSARRLADRATVEALESAIDRFQQLLDATPGGRDAIEALISESSPGVRERREHVAKQATFKSMSFLLGHFCETLATSLFLVPSPNERTVDGIEVQQRIGLQRLRPSAPLALLSVLTPPEDEPPGGSTWIETLDGGLGTFAPRDFLIPEFSSQPLPELEVLVSGATTTFLLTGDARVTMPTRLTSAFRIRDGWSRQSSGSLQPVRGYVLHMPCRTVVRNVFVAEDLFPGGTPRIAFRLPAPGGYQFEGDDDRRHPGTIDLSAPIEQLSSGARAFEVPGIPETRDTLLHVLERAGHAGTRFRGWRCTLAYPIPLIEMFWWLALPQATAADVREAKVQVRPRGRTRGR